MPVFKYDRDHSFSPVALALWLYHLGLEAGIASKFVYQPPKQRNESTAFELELAIWER